MAGYRLHAQWNDFKGLGSRSFLLRQIDIARNTYLSKQSRLQSCVRRVLHASCFIACRVQTLAYVLLFLVNQKKFDFAAT
jgi:hypothetical protein